MPLEKDLIIKLLLALGAAFALSLAATPLVKRFASRVGAMDVPGDARRVHDHPIPRMGGLAIFLGFILSVLLFADITTQVRGILVGTVVIVLTGAVDDVISLNAWVKFGLQILAAIVAAAHGVVIEVLMNPNVFSDTEHLILGILSVPVTIFWIVAVTNSVNLIDGLDGLAVGVSTIASVTILIVAVVVAEDNVAVILAALAGGCLGFMPYNLNPAKIFMGDTGALMLGYVLATVSVLGLFKFYAIVTFIVPVLALAVPVLDTSFAFFRRLIKGQSPMKPDRGHFHHRLLDMGLSQKQAVTILYAVSAILGLCAVLMATTGEMKILILVLAFVIAAGVWLYISRGRGRAPREDEKREDEHGED